MKNIFKLITFCSLALVIASCSKKNEDVQYTPSPGLGGDVWSKGAIDKWLEDSLVKPYNISVKYRWDPWEVNIGANLVPPEEQRIIPALEAMKRIWIDPYNEETGSEAFIRKYAPKQFVMVGSAEYLSNGNMLLGQAEGGKKIAMYVINNFATTNLDELRRMLHTIEHEFGHVLHQTVMYPASFKTITPDYTGTWYNMSNAEAQSRGFATNYARSNPDDDFVETLSTMLIEGKNRWDELVTDQNAAAQAALRKKEAVVVEYFKNVWKINFYSLQERTQKALNVLSPDTFETMFGYDKVFKGGAYLESHPRLPKSGPVFTAAFDSAAYRIDTLTQSELVLSRVDAIIRSANVMELDVYLYSPADKQQFMVASYDFNYTKGADGFYTFNFVSANQPDGTFLVPYLKEMLDFFKNEQFKLSWYQQYSSNNSRYPKVLFTPKQNPNNYFIGLAAR